MKYALILSALVLVILSCKKDESQIVAPSTSQKQYLPMKIGNQWVYESYRLDTLGLDTYLYSDTVRINRDTIIDSQTYAVFEGTYGPFHQQPGIIMIAKEKDGQIVNSLGDTIFSSTNFTSILKEVLIESNPGDTIAYGFFKMYDSQLGISVPAGNFDCLDFLGTYTQFLGIPNIPNPRLVHNYYSEGVGKVKENYFYMSSPSVYEIRLVSYDLKD